jgi:SOS response regulatory protein OraA/RecX
VRALDGNSIIRRAQIVQNLQAKGYKGNEIEDVLKVLHDSDVVKTTAGRYADTYIA